VQVGGIGGSVSPNDNGKSFTVGKLIQLTAVPAYGYLFSNWVATGTVSFVSTNPVLKFSMQSDLVLQANFVTNLFLAVQGKFAGLFEPTNVARTQDNSGSFSLNLTSSGVCSGTLDLGGQSVPFAGRFDVDGKGEIVARAAHGIPALTIDLQLDSASQSISGTISNATFIAQWNGYRAVFSPLDNATDFEGQYTLVIPGTTDPALGPFGDSYGTVNVDDLGNITLAGSLADGTAISQSSVLSQDGYWPLYVSFDGGDGSLWGWISFTNQTLRASPSLSWINGGNSIHAAYSSGFTNQEARLRGGLYLPNQTLPPGLAVTLDESNPPFTILVTNLLQNTNKLTLKTNVMTGVINGSLPIPTIPNKSSRSTA
jgi:hypothetical protein